MSTSFHLLLVILTLSSVGLLARSLDPRLPLSARTNPRISRQCVHNSCVSLTGLELHLNSVNQNYILPWLTAPKTRYDSTFCHSSYDSLSTTRNYSIRLSDKHIINLKSTELSSEFHTFLALSGDVHTNPGPIKNPCTVCLKPVATNHRALPCDNCQRLTHIKCDGVTPKDYTRLQNVKNLTWECPSSRLPNFTDSFIAECTKTNNNFTPIDPDYLVQSLTDISTDSIEIPNQVQNVNNLKILTVNCNSLKSETKRLAFHELIERTGPDVIIATETKLDKSINSQEFDHLDLKLDEKTVIVMVVVY